MKGSVGAPLNGEMIYTEQYDAQGRLIRYTKPARASLKMQAKRKPVLRNVGPVDYSQRWHKVIERDLKTLEKLK